MKDESFYKRMKYSAIDFYDGVRPSIEAQWQATIYPIENRPPDILFNAFDFAGVDAFILDKKKRLYGLSSRVNYAWFKNEPSFSFRYARWDEYRNDWKYEREYQHKLRAANNPGQYQG